MSKIDKKVISILVVLLLLMSYIMPVASMAATAQNVIKDKVLLEANKSWWDENNDGIVSKEEIEKATYVRITKGVSSLSGLEYAKNIADITYEMYNNALDLTTLNSGNLELVLVEIKEGLTNPDISFISNFKSANHVNINADEKTNVDLSALKQLKKLDKLYLLNINVENLNVISTFSSLTELSIVGEKNSFDLTNIDKLNNLNYLQLQDMSLKNVNEIAKLKKLEELYLPDCTGVSNLDVLKNSTNINSISLEKTDISDISFVKYLTDLTYLNIGNTNISNIDAVKGLKKLDEFWTIGSKVSNKDIASITKFADYKAYVGEKIFIEPTIYGLYNYENEWIVTSGNESIVKIAEDGHVQAILNGEATLTIKSTKNPELSKTMKVTVAGIDSNQKSSANIESTFINDKMVLKANGELWRIYGLEAKAEKIATNVSKYVYEFVYTEDEKAFNYTLTKKTDGTVEYEFNGLKTILKDAKDIYRNGYLAKDGTYYEITVDGKWKKITDNVKNIVGSYLIKNDGKTYTVTNKKICDFEIIDAGEYTVVDKDKNVWNVDNGTVKKVGTNFKEYVSDSYYYYTTDGKIMRYDGVEQENVSLWSPSPYNYLLLDKKGNLLLNDKVILTNVVAAEAYREYLSYNRYYTLPCIILRKDGSMWSLKLDGEAELVKISEQSQKLFITNDNIKVKGLDCVDEVITGFDINKLSITDVIKNFSSDYTVKVFKDGKQLTGKDKLCTGSTITLYSKEGKAVKEYKAIVYGDVTGSGKPSAVDALAVIKNSTGKVKIEGDLFLEAARVTTKTRQSGAEPNATDALAIIKANLGKYTIEF